MTNIETEVKEKIISEKDLREKAKHLVDIILKNDDFLTRDSIGLIKDYKESFTKTVYFGLYNIYSLNGYKIERENING